MSITYSGDKITFPDGSTIANGNQGFKNRIINGGMVVNQRATTLTDYGYATDRWSYNPSTSGKASVAQSSTAPTGFTNSLLVTSSAATTIGSSDLYIVEQKIEGYNVADLGWGTANAKTVTLSFWVRSSLTGIFSGVLGNNGPDRSCPFAYTISSANTWEQKTMTITGDTSGTWLTTNGAGIRVIFSLGCGSTRRSTAGSWTGTSNIFAATGETQLLATSGATLYLTGVQLEVGASATSFETRAYSHELALCQRYYWKKVAQPDSGYTMVGAGMMYANADARASLENPVVMRTYPAITFSGSGFGFERANASIGTIGSPVSAYRSPEASLIYSGSGTSTGTAGHGTLWYITDNTSYISVSAEL